MYLDTVKKIKHSVAVRIHRVAIYMRVAWGVEGPQYKLCKKLGCDFPHMFIYDNNTATQARNNWKVLNKLEKYPLATEQAFGCLWPYRGKVAYGISTS
jgi:hypothetical protein